MHFVQIKVNLNLAVERAHDVHAGDFGQRFDFVFELVGVNFQFFQRIVTRQIDVHNRKFRKVYGLHRRVLFAVVGQVYQRLVHGIGHPLLGDLWRDTRIKLNGNQRKILNRIGLDFRNAAGRFDLFFERFGNNRFNIRRTCPWINR